MRTYSGNPEFANQLAGYADDIENLIGGVQGFRSYFLIQTKDGATTVTVCDDEAGCEESTRLASEWLRDHASEIQASPPQITGGDVVFQLGATANV